MATVKKIPSGEYRVELNLSRFEARALQKVLGQVSGGVLDDIWKQLGVVLGSYTIPDGTGDRIHLSPDSVNLGYSER